MGVGGGREQAFGTQTSLVFVIADTHDMLH